MQSIQRECNEIGSVPVGGAAITSGGNLKARHIIHAASMELGGDTTARALRTSTAHALRIASERKPAHDRVSSRRRRHRRLFRWQIARRSCCARRPSYLKEPTSIEKIYFVLFDAKALEAFAKQKAVMEESGAFGGGAAAAGSA